MRNRAVRRHHRDRMRARAKKVQERWWSYTDYTEEELHNAASALADNIKLCSCSMCCNPRHSGWWHVEKKTWAERRSLVDYEEYLKETCLSG